MDGGIIVAVGSLRQPKLDAVREAFLTIGAALEPGARFHVTGVDVPSRVRHTPLSTAETMAGARARVEALRTRARERNEPWRYFLGLEGGLDVFDDAGSRRVFLQSWACVADASGRIGWGQAGAVLLPDSLAEQVVDRGVELGVAIDQFAGSHGIRDNQGAWGVLTRGMMTRQDAFRIAVLNAFAPFSNADLYRQS
jgi:inosine/xanthosine triphosphatase